MAEAFTKPGTANVSPADRVKLKSLLAHYAKKAHPFTACKRDQMKHGLSEDHANRRCAVLKDLIRGTTKWRKGAKNLSVAELREVIDMADASGLDCPTLTQARRVLAVAEAREQIDMAKKREPSEATGPLQKHRLTRGPRKGQVVEGRYINGKFYEVKTNTQKGNPRAGEKFVALKRKDGKRVHRYRKGGKTIDIVVK